MRSPARWLILLGVANVLGSAVIFLLHSIAFGTQYSGMVVRLAASEHATEGSPDYERIRLQVLDLLGRTSPMFFASVCLIAATGVFIIVVGIRMRANANRPITAGSPA